MSKREEADSLKNLAEETLRQIQAISEEIGDREEEKKKLLKQHKGFLKKLDEFKLYFRKEETEFDIEDGNLEIFVLEFVCFKVDEWEKPKVYHIVDDTGDPSFNCPNCEQEHNHCLTTESEYESLDKYHNIRLLGKIKLSKLREIILNDR